MGGFYPPKICKHGSHFAPPPQKKKIPKHGSNLLKIRWKNHGENLGKWVYYSLSKSYQNRSTNMGCLIFVCNNVLNFTILCIKVCIENDVSALKNTRASGGFAPWTPIRGFGPEPHRTGALKWAPGPHAAKLTRVGRFIFFFFFFFFFCTVSKH